MSRLRVLVLALALTAPVWPALASTYDSVITMLGDPAVPPADIIKLVTEATDEFLPRHVYALVDRGAPKDLISAVAIKAAIFYDGTLEPLQVQAAKARAGQPPQTIPLHSAEDIIILFEWFNDLKYEREAAIAAVGELAPQAAGELTGAYDKRARVHEEAVATTRARFEGRIDVTTFEIALPATFDAYDTTTGCIPKARFLVDLGAVNFYTFREAMGGPNLTSPITQTKPVTVATLHFSSDGTRRFEGLSKPVCVSADAARAVTADDVKFKLLLKRTYKGQDWTGVGEFVNAKTGANLTVRR
jgi:hypothetical protein